MAKTLAAPTTSRQDNLPPEGSGKQLIQNYEANQKVVEMLKKQQGKLANQFNAQIAERRQSPYRGEMVDYKMPEGPSVGELRPAVVLALLGDEGDTTRCVLKVLCNPDLDGVGVLDEPNVRSGEGLGEWMPADPRIPMKDPDLSNRVPVGDS